MTYRSGRAGTILQAALRGAAAGAAGVAAMTATEVIEQRFTGRPDSFVGARALLALLGRPVGDTARPLAWNHAMHWGTGAVLGLLRGTWAVTGLRGAEAHVLFAVVRLAVDQTVENATGVGAPPRTWPSRERVIDVVHKAVYAVSTGIVAESLIRPTLESHRGRTSH